MMKILEQIEKDLIEAVKSKDEVTVLALRGLKSEIKNQEIKKMKGLDEAEIGQVIAIEIKKRRDSITQFKQGERDDLVKNEEAEIKVLEKYQPEQLSEEEIKEIAVQIINETGAKGSADMGRVMSQLMPKLAGKADGSTAAQIVQELLAKS